MTHIWFVGLVTTFFGLSIGGITAYFINSFKKSISTIYAMCTGLILGLISFEIAPAAIQLGNWIVLSLGFLAGVLLFKLIESLMTVELNKFPGIRSGLLLTIVISVHNLPIGVILGASQQSDLSISLLQTLIVHNIPEGMIFFTLLFSAQFNFPKLFVLSFIVAIPVAIGALLGGMIGMQNNYLWAFLISLTVGTIYMVTIKEVLPESRRRSSNMYSLIVVTITFCLLGAYFLLI